MTNKPKIKKCCVCEAEFSPFNSLHKVCSTACAIVYSQRNVKKQFKKDARKAKKAMNDNDRSYQTKRAQQAFNAYIRERDKDQPCISCGQHHDGQYHAGHYQSTGAHSSLRWHPMNNHKQCAPCNNHLSGNIVNYRPRLIDKIGLKAVEWLETSTPANKMTVDDIKEIKQFYKEQLKILKTHPFNRWTDGLGD